MKKNIFFLLLTLCLLTVLSHSHQAKAWLSSYDLDKKAASDEKSISSDTYAKAKVIIADLKGNGYTNIDLFKLPTKSYWTASDYETLKAMYLMIQELENYGVAKDKIIGLLRGVNADDEAALCNNCKPEDPPGCYMGPECIE